jgi:hypothetical protein
MGFQCPKVCAPVAQLLENNDICWISSKGQQLQLASVQELVNVQMISFIQAHAQGPKNDHVLKVTR